MCLDIKNNLDKSWHVCFEFKIIKFYNWTFKALFSFVFLEDKKTFNFHFYYLMNHPQTQ